MGKHTPGPWKVGIIPDTENVFVEASDGLIVCEVGGFVIGKEQAQTNAHLIAAAPDLLDALKDIMTDHIDNLTYQEDCDCAGCHRIAKAQAAIAKAEGNS